METEQMIKPIINEKISEKEVAQANSQAIESLSGKPITDIEKKPISNEIKSDNKDSSSPTKPESDSDIDKKSNISDKDNKTNPMRQVEIEKMVLNCGGIDDKLERSVKLLELVTGKKVLITKAKKRIPGFGISPGKGAGCKVTLRNKEQINQLLKRFLATFSNEISEKKIRDNHLSFGIHEYIEVPGLEYQREIGILGFEVDIVFKRKGKRVKIRKIKRGKYPKKQGVTKQEIIDFLENKFGAGVLG